MPQQPGLNQLNLVVRDMDATLGFYRRLGLDVEADPGAFHAAATFRAGCSSSGTAPSSSPNGTPDGTGRPEAAPCSASG